MFDRKLVVGCDMTQVENLTDDRTFFKNVEKSSELYDEGGVGVSENLLRDETKKHSSC
jgi:hypothetical protein